MREILGDLLRWWTAGATTGVALVTATWSSAPRQPGAAMAVGPDGTVVGGVSGGCVEGAVFDLCLRVAAEGRPLSVRYGVTDDDAWEVGLPCGGTVDVLVVPVGRDTFPELPALVAAVTSGRPVALLTTRDGHHRVLTDHGLHQPPVTPTLTAPPAPDRAAPPTSPSVDEEVVTGAIGMLRDGLTGPLSDSFVTTFPAPARMLIFGSGDHAAAVSRIGAFLGYRVTVCDARPAFTTDARFPDADEVVVDWPHRYLRAEADAGRLDTRTVVCVLTHDAKFDVPVLAVALDLPIAHVGAMGSRRTRDDRLARLAEAGVGAERLARLSAPIGLDLGARTPEETAVSIAAEIVALRNGGTGRRLTTTDGPIHPHRA